MGADGAAEQLVGLVGQVGRPVLHQGDQGRDGGAVAAGQQPLRRPEADARIGVGQQLLHVGALLGRARPTEDHTGGGPAARRLVLEGGDDGRVHFAVVDAEDGQGGHDLVLDGVAVGVGRVGQERRRRPVRRPLADQPGRGPALGRPVLDALRVLCEVFGPLPDLLVAVVEGARR